MILFFFLTMSVIWRKQLCFIQDEITGIHMLLHWSTNMNAMKGTFINIYQHFKHFYFHRCSQWSFWPHLIFAPIISLLVIKVIKLPNSSWWQLFTMMLSFSEGLCQVSLYKSSTLEGTYYIDSYSSRESTSGEYFKRGVASFWLQDSFQTGRV